MILSVIRSTKFDPFATVTPLQSKGAEEDHLYVIPLGGGMKIGPKGPYRNLLVVYGFLKVFLLLSIKSVYIESIILTLSVSNIYFKPFSLLYISLRNLKSQI